MYPFFSVITLRNMLESCDHRAQIMQGAKPTDEWMRQCCIISTGLCRLASWRSMSMQHGIDVCTGSGPDLLHCRGHLSPRGKITGADLPFQLSRPVGAGSAHAEGSFPCATWRRVRSSSYWLNVAAVAATRVREVWTKSSHSERSQRFPYWALMFPLSLISSHCHCADFQCWRCDPAAHVEIIADHGNVRQHLTQIPGNGDFFYRIGQCTMLNP
jgi:hypothetical protein